MNRNKKGRWWYLAFKTLSVREVLFSVIGFAVSFVWIWNAAGQYRTLFKELQKPVVIQAEMAENLSSDARTSIQAIQGVEAMTPYSEQTAVMQWEDYSGEVSVYYVDSDYMKWLSGQAMAAEVPFSEGMPYGIVSEKALENLSKKTQEQSRITSMLTESEDTADGSSQKDKKKQGLLLEKSDLLKDFTLDGSQSVRLYGVDQNEQMLGVYLSNQWAEAENEAGFAVSSGGAEDSEFGDMPADDAATGNMDSKSSANDGRNDMANAAGGSQKDSSASENDNQVSVKIMIAVKNGFSVSSVIKNLEQLQIEAKSDVTEVINQTNEKNISRLETGGMIFICASFMMYMSEQLWKIRHIRWLEDIRRFGAEANSDRKILRRRRLLMIGIGVVGSFAWQWLSILYGWL